MWWRTASGELDLEAHWGEDIPQEYVDEAYGLARTSGINILSDKELHHVLTHDGQTIGALWVGYSPQGMSFDVAVHPEYRRKGIGSRLVSETEGTWRADREAYEDGALSAYAVGDGMPELLESRGWKGEGQHWQYPQ